MRPDQELAHVSGDELREGDEESGVISMYQMMAGYQSTYLPNVLVVLFAPVSQPGEADDGATSEDACA